VQPQRRTLAARLRAWFQDDVFRRVFVNAGKLLSGSGAAALIALASAALEARYLGPGAFGTLALVRVYVESMGELWGFQSWQTIVKYGSDLRAARDEAGLRQLFKLGFGLDLGSAILGLLVALLASGPLVAWLGWDPALRPLILIYAWSILFNLRGTAMGALRLFNRFDLLSYASILSAAARLAGISWAIVTRQDLAGFAWLYLVTAVGGHLYLLLAALRVLERQGVRRWWTAAVPRLSVKFPGIWPYLWSTNLNLTLRLVARDVDVLLLGSVTAAEVVGVYRLAKSVGAVLTRFSDPVYQAIYPEMARLWAEGRRAQLLAMVKRVSAIFTLGALAAGLGFLLFGRPAMQAAFGAQYDALGLYGAALLYLLASAIGVASVVLQPLALTLGLPVQVFGSNLILTPPYFLLLVVAARQAQAPGAAFAYLAFTAASVLWRAWIVWRGWRRAGGMRPAPDPALGATQQDLLHSE
jgi:O-antigen/teichoic acid export membrane protein